MDYKFAQYKENLYAKQWVIPFIMALSGLIAAIVLLFCDYKLHLPRLINFVGDYISADGARITLSIIASSVITITSVTFSITVLTLSIQSNQLGPRLLPNFMRQKTTQLALGFFIGTFIYCLIVLQSVVNFNGGQGLPYLSVLIGLLLGIFSFFILIYFIHFVCHVIQIDNVLDFLTDNLIQSIKRQLPEKASAEHDINKVINATEDHRHVIEKFKDKTDIKSIDWGYIQTIDYEALFALAKKHELLIKVLIHPGHFAFSGMTLITVWHNEELSDALKSDLLDAFQLGKRRSTVQDVEFAFEELAEISLRALSPGINNPYTAVHCLDRMAQGFAALGTRQILSKQMCDDDGNIFVIRQISGYGDIVGTALNRLRQQAQQDLSAAIHMVSMISSLSQLTLPLALKQALKQQADDIYAAIMKQDLRETDKQSLDYFYKRIE